MAFTGDVGQISLLNIYQALNLNQQGGVLVISSGAEKRKIRFVSDGIRLLANEPGDPEPLRSILSKLRILTESQFQNAVSTKNDSSQTLGDFLIQRRLIDADLVGSGVSKHALELIYETFFWKPAKYEFNAGDEGDEFELFHPEDYGPYLTYRIEGVLMEVARREDEWSRITDLIASEKEIFVPTDPRAFANPREYQSELAADDIADIKKLLDGERTLETVVQETKLSRYEAHRAVVLLYSEREIRPLLVAEKKTLAEKLRKKFKINEVVDIYSQLLLEDPDDIETRTNLVALLEKKKDHGSELIDHYHFLSDHFDALGEITSAKSHLEKIVHLDPHNLDAHDKLFKIFWKMQKEREALAEARLIVDSVKVTKRYAEGAELLENIVHRYPRETTFYHECADFHQFNGSPEHAIRNLKAVAAIYESREDFTRLRKTFERVASIDPSERSSLKRCQELERKTTRTATTRVISPLISSLAAIFLFCIGYWGAMEFFCREVYGAVSTDVDLLVENGGFDDATRVLNSVQAIYPLSTTRWEIAHRLRRITEIKRKTDQRKLVQAEEKNTHFTSYLAQVTRSLRDRKYSEAWEAISSFDREGLSKANLEKLEEIESTVRDVFDAADDLRVKAESLTKARKFKQAHAAYVKLLMGYPQTPATRDLQAPLVLRTVPPGADVLFDGKLVGKSPLLLRYNPFRRFRLTVRKPGFREYSCGEGSDIPQCVEFTRDWLLTVSLERVPDWTVRSLAESETPPSISGDSVFIASRDGRIRCLNRNDGSERWNGGPFGHFGIQDRIKRHGTEVFFGTKEGGLVILRAADGKPTAQLSPFGDRWKGKVTSTEPNEKGIICIRGGPNVAGVAIASRRLVWKISNRDFLDLPPIRFKNTAIMSSSKGELVLLSLSTGNVVRTVRVSGSLIQRGTVSGDSYLVVNTDGVIQNVDLTDGEVLWSYRAMSSRLARPTVSKNHVILHSDDGHLFGLDLARGTRAWEYQLSDKFPRPGVLAQGRFVVASESGLMLCLNPESGSPYWTFKAETKITLEPVAEGRHLLVLGGDGTLSAFVVK